MGVRPPANGNNDETASMEFGIADLDARIKNRDVSFPIAASELKSNHGEMEISVDPSGTPMKFGAALEQSDRDEFDSKQELLNELHPIFEEERERRSGGIVGRLRSLVPF